MARTHFSNSPDIRVVESSATQLRLAEARAFAAAHIARTADVHMVGASRGSVDDLARSIAVASGATIGLHRFSLTQLAARLASPTLALDGYAPATYLGTEAVAARAAFDAQQADALSYFAPVARTPGFARALARTLQELRLAGVTPAALSELPLGGPDLAALLERFEAHFSAATARDRATVFTVATDAVTSGTAAGIDLSAPLLLLDVPLDTRLEFDFVRALISASSDVLITVPFGDIAALNRFKGLRLTPELLVQSGPADLVALRRYMFARSKLQERTPQGDVQFFSAPGEGRECVEIARRVLDEVRRGVKFDEIAVFVRSPDRYAGLLEHAFRRVHTAKDSTEPSDRTDRAEPGVPAFFDRGTRRPHPAGRAFLAILACRCERLSARRFAEYLSLAQVPQLDGPRREFDFIVPDDEVLDGLRAAAEGVPSDEGDQDGPAQDVDPGATTDRTTGSTGDDAPDESAVVDGSLRAPWQWETLIVESAVIGGDPHRWHRRLAGLDQEYRIKILAESKEDPDSPRVARLERDRRNLVHLRTFALPIIDELAAWPEHGSWGEWLDRFGALAPRVLRRPERVLRVLGELRPMSEIGPVSLEEAREVITERLLLLESESPKSRYGRVFVGSPLQARGRTFKVVFVPGLAERMFPQKPHEDPMMLDEELRMPLGADLPVQQARAQAERLLLRLAVGAATDRLWLSYPRIEMAESRPRVPSFYALDVMRAITGRIPSHEELQTSAATVGGAGLAWPSPPDPKTAIDDLEHDLAVLRELLDADSARVRGHAHYLLRLNENLKRSVTARWGRARSQWTAFDGITRLNSNTKPVLDSQRLATRAYSLSALQKFASCPYQFLLSAIYRLHPAEEPEPLQKLDPLTRGALFHEVQAEFFRSMQADGRLPVVEAQLPVALQTLERIITRVASRYHERLAPAIERVWRDEIADIAKDLRVWVRRLKDAGDWIPAYFELSFGLPRELAAEGRDPHSLPDPVLVDGRFLLRGSIDLVENKRGQPLLRVTDHKTGRNRTTWKTVIGGGAILQPVLYSLAVQQALGATVTSGRLFYCTAPGGFTDHEIPINDANRRAGLEALEIVDRAIELGFLPAAPDKGACAWCDFRAVCGPHEEQRVANKMPEKLSDLAALREKA
ncbi:MAG: PD-(D/E)XK nuclease family protein [Acidobacteria bacterium]|nr:PD-(D/E)XK nuclease family protein [Acidobacteriota bacterium]